MRRVFALVLIPLLSRGGVLYEVDVRPVDEANLSMGGPAAAPVVTHCFVEDGKVRVGGSDAKMAYLFADQTMTAIDNTARTAHVLKHATLSQYAAHYADAVKQLKDASAAAPESEKAVAEQKAANAKAVSDRMLAPVDRDFKVTVRFESVDGHACRIWEEREGDAKRLELCVAQTASVPGGADILKGLKTLSQFRQGSDFAFRVEFGLSEWWPDFASLGGLPLLIREYKFDSLVSEIKLTGMRPATPRAGQLSIPDGYQVVDGPDYTQWFIR